MSAGIASPPVARTVRNPPYHYQKTPFLRAFPPHIIPARKGSPRDWVTRVDQRMRHWWTEADGERRRFDPRRRKKRKTVKEPARFYIWFFCRKRFGTGFFFNLVRETELLRDPTERLLRTRTHTLSLCVYAWTIVDRIHILPGHSSELRLQKQHLKKCHGGNSRRPNAQRVSIHLPLRWAQDFWVLIPRIARL